MFITIIKNVVKFIWNIFKHVLLLPFYCAMPDKYGGVGYDEWLDKNDL